METPTHTAERLLGDFPVPTYEDWRALVESELKGAPFEKRMCTETYEGIRLQPLYGARDIAALPHVPSYPGCTPFVRGTNAAGYLRQPWLVVQAITAATPAEFNRQVQLALQHGVQALAVDLDPAGPGAAMFSTLAELDAALAGIDLAQVPLYLRSGPAALPFAALLAALAEKRNVPREQLRACCADDPLSGLASNGCLVRPLGEAYDHMAALTHWAVQGAPGLCTVSVQSQPWHEAGGSAVQELAFSLATALEYLRALDGRGLNVEQAAPHLRFDVTVGEQFFMEIAKLRALRLLWSRLVGSLGGSERAQAGALHVRTSRWNKTAVDPYNNLLRATVESFAAITGGCASLEVGPFDEVFRAPDEFSERLARNTQLILQRECQLTRVIDPAGGSWYVESLTAALAQEAWTLFQEVEQRGGMLAALEQGFPQQQIATTSAQKLANVARRRDLIVGVNQYANPLEQPLATRAAGAASRPAPVSGIVHPVPALAGLPAQRLFAACVAAATGSSRQEIAAALRTPSEATRAVTPVRPTRAAAGFEALRAAMHRQSAPVSVFLCQMGAPKEYKARADYAAACFAAGGYQIQAPAAYATPEAAAAALAATDAPIAVLCSLDANYPALVPPLVAALRARRPGLLVVLAGYPAEQVEAHRKAGVDEFIHLRADTLAVLTKIHAHLGLAR